MGAFDQISELCSDWSRVHKSKKYLKKHKQLQDYPMFLNKLRIATVLEFFRANTTSLFGHMTVEIKVKMDCEGCERRVKKAAQGAKGVTQVEVEPKIHKLTVIGYVEPHKILHRVRHKTGKMAELWPYVPYDEIDHPYVPGVYDKKAPPGYVRSTLENPKADSLARASSTEVTYSTAFSDDNPNACLIM